MDCFDLDLSTNMSNIINNPSSEGNVSMSDTIKNESSEIQENSSRNESTLGADMYKNSVKDANEFVNTVDNHRTDEIPYDTSESCTLCVTTHRYIFQHTFLLYLI